MSHELYKLYRPKRLEDVVGNKATLESLRKRIEAKTLQHACMFIGPSGSGKTTVARIASKSLGAGKGDIQEINVGNTNGVDFIRTLTSRANLAPMHGESKVYILDEAQRLTSEAQNCLLKILEDCPKHVYFFICTTDPQKLLKAVHTRCTKYAFSEITDKECDAVLTRVCKLADITNVSTKVKTHIFKSCNGSARQALVFLDQVKDLDNEDEQLSAIAKGDVEAESIELCRALLARKPFVTGIAPILKNLQDDPESVRRSVLGYMNSGFINGWATKDANTWASCARILYAFEKNFYDTGKAGLTIACLEALKK